MEFHGELGLLHDGYCVGACILCLGKVRRAGRAADSILPYNFFFLVEWCFPEGLVSVLRRQSMLLN